MDTRLGSFSDQPIFITSDNINAIDKIFFDEGLSSLVSKIERETPEIFEDNIIKNTREEVIDSIKRDRLYTAEEAKKQGKNKNRAKAYSSQEIKEIAKNLQIAIGKKTKDELILEVKAMLE